MLVGRSSQSTVAGWGDKMGRSKIKQKDGGRNSEVDVFLVP